MKLIDDEVEKVSETLGEAIEIVQEFQGKKNLSLHLLMCLKLFDKLL